MADFFQACCLASVFAAKRDYLEKSIDILNIVNNDVDINDVNNGGNNDVNDVFNNDVNDSDNNNVDEEVDERRLNAVFMIQASKMDWLEGVEVNIPLLWLPSKATP